MQANTSYTFTSIWIDDNKDLIEAVDPKIEILHYGNGIRNYDLPPTQMVRRERGIYDYTMYVSMEDFSFDLDYLVLYSAKDSSNVLGTIEDSFRIYLPSTNEGISTSTVR